MHLIFRNVEGLKNTRIILTFSVNHPFRSYVIDILFPMFTLLTGKKKNKTVTLTVLRLALDVKNVELISRLWC